MRNDALCLWYCQQAGNVSMLQAGYGKWCVANAEGSVSLKYCTTDKRLATFSGDVGHANTHIYNSQLAEAGFYRTLEGEHPQLKCFRCHLVLRMLDYRCDPFREHARWSPRCPYVMEKNGVEFIHDILEETVQMKEDHDGRRATTDSNVYIQLIEDGYETSRIKDAVIKFFGRNGAYPTYDALMAEM